MRQNSTSCTNISVDMSEVGETIAESVAVEEVSQLLCAGDGQTLLLDCRPFMAFNENHIVNAVNVYLPPILKRRSNGFVSLENIVQCESRRKMLQDKQFVRVIAYDNDTTALATSAKDSNLYPVLKSLRQQIDIDDVLYICGGFQQFQESFPDLCIGQNGKAEVTSLTPPPKRTTCKSGPVEIVPWLYLGDSHHSCQQAALKEMGVTCLLNVSTTCKNMFEAEFDYMNIPVNDTDTANLACWFMDAIQFIDNARDSDGKVLVHCQAGVSRSATVCIAYMMYKNSMSLEDAFDYVRSRRGQISPNLNFMQQLKQFENDLYERKMFDISETVSSLSTSLASVEFDMSNASTEAFSATSSVFDFSFASPALTSPIVPPLSPREIVSAS